MEPLYRLENVRHVYDRRPVLAIEALEVRSGAALGIVGPNGSGKSTLLKLMGMLEAPTAGDIRFNGRPADPFVSRLRDRVALLPQDTHLLNRSVRSNVGYGLRLRGRAADAKHVGEALQWVGLNPGEFAGRAAHELSGGEAKRVALAARLILRPEVLLLDEPTTSVDAFSARLIRDAVLRARAEWNTTLVIASHDRQWLAEISDDLLHLYRGRIIGDGRENLLFGPWQRFEHGWGQATGDGQEMRVPDPPAADAIAVLTTAEVGPVGSRVQGAVVLRGTITGMALENADRTVAVSVRVGRLVLTVMLPSERIRASGLHPGAAVDLGYDPSGVAWLDENGAT